MCSDRKQKFHKLFRTQRLIKQKPIQLSMSTVYRIHIEQFQMQTHSVLRNTRRGVRDFRQNKHGNINESKKKKKKL